jgi:hypothetical protein
VTIDDAREPAARDAPRLEGAPATGDGEAGVDDDATGIGRRARTSATGPTRVEGEKNDQRSTTSLLFKYPTTKMTG